MQTRSILRALAGLVLIGSLLGPHGAEALPVLDFGIVAPTPGTLSYAGGAAPLIGSLIQVDNIVGLETPTHDGVTYALLGGQLTFSTGALVASSSTRWSFGPGGSLTLSGAVDVNGNGLADSWEPAGELLAGTFTGLTDVLVAGTSIRVLATAFSAALLPEMAALYGIAAGSTDWDGAINLSFVTPRRPPFSFTTTQLLSGDIVGTVPVPEASTLLVVGLGMVAMGYVLGRRRPSPARVRDVATAAAQRSAGLPVE